VKSLEKDSSGTVVTSIENATDPEIKPMIQQTYGFKTHGLVFFAPDGETVQATMGGHLMTNEEIAAKLETVLAAE